MKRVLNFVINLLIALLILGIGYFIVQDFPSIYQFSRNQIYFPFINPKAGALAYEKEYKITSDKAEKLRLKTNKLVDEEKNKSLDLKDQSMTDFNKDYDAKLQDIFNERDQYLIELIEIDNKSAKLALHSEYKEFYDKRLKADQNEYEAFKDYRAGMETLSKGMILYDFGEVYSPMMDLLVDYERLTKDNISQLELNLSQFESYYNAHMVPLITDDFFTKDISNDLENKLKTMKVISNFQIARLSGDDVNAKKYYQEIESISTEVTSPKTPTEMFLDWSKEKVQPFFYLQDTKHNKSYTMFNDAYKFASIKKLKEIVTIWNGNYPGSINTPEIKPTYNL